MLGAPTGAHPLTCVTCGEGRPERHASVGGRHAFGKYPDLSGSVHARSGRIGGIPTPGCQAGAPAGGRVPVGAHERCTAPRRSEEIPFKGVLAK